MRKSPRKSIRSWPGSAHCVVTRIAHACAQFWDKYSNSFGTGLELALAALRVLRTTATPYSTFVSTVQDDLSLRYVENSGVCETTPGVRQFSGYLNVGTNMSMWFWFFEAREHPETAPLTLWLNGGPGCSSMVGLFQENGPCLVNPDGQSTTINPYSWNNVSNMLYIDQPIGTGFSYGTVTVGSTQAAAPFIWQAFQILFESNLLSKYQAREFIFATESYGGHYGPSFVSYFDEQNASILKGELKGELINVSAMMINNGWFDPLLQNKAYIDFATYAPGYGQLQSDAVLKNITQAFYGPNGCKIQEEACYAAGNSTASNEICATADDYCINNVFIPAVGDRDDNDLRQNASAPNPFLPNYYVNFLNLASVKQAIGAIPAFSTCSDTPLFTATGDDARTWLPQLGALVNSGLKTLIWAGDADINCNWLGGHASVLAMNWYGQERLQQIPLQNITFNGKTVAAVQNLDNFSFARVYAAGHEVPAFQPEAALKIFEQIIHYEPLHSV